MAERPQASEKKMMDASSLVRPVSIPEEQLGSIREKQLLTVGSLLPVIGLANLINAAVVVMSFWDTPANRLLGAWCFVVVLATTIMFIGYSRMRSSKVRPELATADERSKEGIERFARFASFVGLLWGILPLLILPLTD